MTFTEEDLRNAFRAGQERGRFDANYNYFDAPFDEDEWVKSYTEPVEEEEEKITVTYSMIKKTCGWSKFCDVTDGNHWAINEFGDFDDNHTFEVTKTQFNKLW